MYHRFKIVKSLVRHREVYLIKAFQWRWNVYPKSISKQAYIRSPVFHVFEKLFPLKVCVSGGQDRSELGVREKGWGWAQATDWARRNDYVSQTLPSFLHSKMKVALCLNTNPHTHKHTHKHTHIHTHTHTHTNTF